MKMRKRELIKEINKAIWQFDYYKKIVGKYEVVKCESPIDDNGFFLIRNNDGLVLWAEEITNKDLENVLKDLLFALVENRITKENKKKVILV